MKDDVQFEKAVRARAENRAAARRNSVINVFYTAAVCVFICLTVILSPAFDAENERPGVENDINGPVYGMPHYGYYINGRPQESDGIEVKLAVCGGVVALSLGYIAIYEIIKRRNAK